MESLQHYYTEIHGQIYQFLGAQTLLNGVPNALLVEIIVAILLLLVTIKVCHSLNVRLHQLADKSKFIDGDKLYLISRPLLYLLLLWIALNMFASFEITTLSLRIAMVLGTGWLLANCVTAINKLPKSLKKLGVFAAWVLPALLALDGVRSMFGWLGGLSFTLGGVTISLLAIMQGIAVFGVLVWVLFTGAELLEANMKKRRVKPAARTLLVKLIKIGGLVLVVPITFNTLGISLSSLAIFGGALGIGIGFGLRAITSNFISGILLLMDRSINPGDVISVDDSYGQVTKMNTRYVVLRRRDGLDVLVPNEQLMTNQVVNWSFSNRKVRQDVFIGVDYNSDMEQVQKILLEAVRGVNRVLDAPVPRVFLHEFGDSSVNFIIRFWQNDPEEGVTNLKGNVNMALWKALKANNIQIPFPQRVLHMADAEADIAAAAKTAHNPAPQEKKPATKTKNPKSTKK